MTTLLAGYRQPVEVPAPLSQPMPDACLTCGTPYPLERDSQKRIAELEAQVRLLTEKAAAAVDKLADYEDELRRLKNSQNRGSVNAIASSSEPNLPATAGAASPDPGVAALAPKPTAQGRFAALLGTRRISASPAANNPPSRPPSVREAELQEALARELEARQQAETKVTQMSGELEELSMQLFQQANEMVASERKARAKLEERVEVLEKRDGDKRKRLDRLENAVKRIERVHGLLKG